MAKNYASVLIGVGLLHDITRKVGNTTRLLQQLGQQGGAIVLATDTQRDMVRDEFVQKHGAGSLHAVFFYSLQDVRHQKVAGLKLPHPLVWDNYAVAMMAQGALSNLTTLEKDLHKMRAQYERAEERANTLQLVAEQKDRELLQLKLKISKLESEAREAKGKIGGVSRALAARKQSD